MTKDDAFARLAESKFRSRFELTAEEREYIVEKGMDTIRRHTTLNTERLARHSATRDA